MLKRLCFIGATMLFVAIWMLMSCSGRSGKDVAAILQTITDSLDLDAGIAWAFEDGQVQSINNDDTYPLMSVFKIPVVTAVLLEMQSAETSLDTIVHVSVDEMLTDTYSPLLDIYPGQDFDMSVRTLMSYCISLSDNNATDILIRFAGGLDNIHSTLSAVGIDNCHFTETEATMRDRETAYHNWATPADVVELIRKVYDGDILKGEYLSALKETMLSTSTGQDKIAAGLPEGAVLAHKTGSSGTDTVGRYIADNDAGVIILPDGRKIYIAILLKDSAEPKDVRTEVFGKVTSVICEGF